MIKICQVRLVKMDIAEFDYRKLLNMGGHPGKFYLVGFAPHEFVKLTNLIRNYGGAVVSPDDETIILSNTDEPPEIQCFPHFHIKWLHDSLAHNKQQDIGKYLLPRHGHAAPRMNTGTAFQPSHIGKEPNHCSTPYHGDVLKEKDSHLNVYGPKRNGEVHRSLTFPKGSDHQNILSRIMTLNSERASHSDNVRRSHEIQEESTDVTKKRSKKRSADGHKCSGEIEKKKTKKKHKKTKEARSSTFAKNDKSSENIVHVSSTSSFEARDGDETTVVPDETSIKDTNGDNAIDEGHVTEGSGCQDPVGVTTIDKETVKCSSEEKANIKRSNKHYSHEDNLRIFQYLADNNLVAKANRDFVWTLMADSEIFQNPPRTASGLRQHFHKILLPNHLKYTTDSHIIAELGKMETKKLKNIIGHIHGEPDDGNTSDHLLTS